jgi:hypothetical protein
MAVVAGKDASGLLKMDIGVIEKQKKKTVVYFQDKEQIQKKNDQDRQQRIENGWGGWLARRSFHEGIVK